MFEKVLVATDLSPASYAVLNCIGGLRGLGAQQAHLVLCLSEGAAASLGLEQRRELIDKNVEEQKAVLQGLGFQVSAEVVSGSAKLELNRVAMEKSYPLIVAGSQGRTLAGEMFLGGVASALIHHSEKPVLLVRVRDDGERGAVCMCPDGCSLKRHILFATDFSAASMRAFSYCLEAAATGAERVTLMHVQEKARLDPHLVGRLPEFNETDRRRLNELSEAILEKSGVVAGIEVRYGNAAREILGFAAREKASLTIVGTHGRGYFSGAFTGSVSHNIARHSLSPVLLIPPSGKD